MDVRIVTFPETRVAVIEHRGPPLLEHETVRKLVAWKLRHRLLDPQKHRSYGLHYTDPSGATRPEAHRVDFCLSIDDLETTPDETGDIHFAVLPRLLRCALVRDIGSREDNKAAVFLRDVWLPGSGEAPAPGSPVIFHYVNVGPGVRDEEMITDVYLPLRAR